MTISKKERMQRVFKHEPLDHIPIQVNYTPALGEAMAAHYGVAAADLPDYFGNHFLRLDIDFDPVFSEDKKIKYDWWGVGFDAEEEGYFTAVNPLAESKDLDAYPWPDPDAPGLLDKAAKILEADQDKHFTAPNFGFALFERAWSLRGFDTFMMDMALDKKFAGEMLDRITEIQLKLIHRFIDLGVDGGYFGDDYGAQKNMLFSPRMWRKLIKPRLARMFEPFKEAGLPVFMHSDGQIQAVLPDLVEIGLNGLNPVQPEVLEHAWLYENFKGKLAFYGGISTQTVLPYGKPQEVKTAVKKCVEELAPEGTGLILAPSHRMMTDIPLENIDAMLEAFKAVSAE